MAIELEYLRHLRRLVSSFDNDDGEALIGIVGKARTRIQELVAANDNEKRVDLFSGKYVFVHLGGYDYSLIDAADYGMISQFRWELTKHETHRYARGIDANGHYTMMHRLLMDAKKGQLVDHINGKCTDNRRSNLRFATLSQNAMNKKTSKQNTSGHKGVHWNKAQSKWIARIKVKGVSMYLGQYDDVLQAAEAYSKAAKEHHGEFARLS